MNTWREDLIPINPFSRPGTPLQSTRKICWHYTGNPGASAANHVGYFGKTLPASGDRYASAHIFIDATEAVLIIPLNEEAYHASQANAYSIGIELCVEADGTFHPDTVQRAVEIGAELCKRYTLDPFHDNIRHYDVTGKICPRPWVMDPWAWSEFKTSVDREMEDYDMDRLTLNDEQWAALVASLQKAYDDGLLGDYRFVERAYKGKLTHSELGVANNLIIVNGAVR